MHRTDELFSHLHNALRELARAGWLALLVLVLTLLRLAIVVARLFPFALRLATFLLWSVGVLEVWRSAFALYSAFSDTIATTLTALAVVVACAVIPIPFLRTNREMAWGAFLAGAAVSFTLKTLGEWVHTQPQWYWLASIAPSVLAGTLILMMALDQFQKGGTDGEKSFTR
jgi:hypothetical protein